uniref:Barrier-to-autointegration factor n=1 Tax=Sus scrofa TaxID=9823 RepID=A0A8D1L3F3_PIG
MRISQKHRDFVAEPMGEKPMGSLVGIGEVMGKKLEERGFDKACIVLGQFLVFKMKTSSGNGGRTCMVPTPSIKDCFGCLWSDNNHCPCKFLKTIK